MSNEWSTDTPSLMLLPSARVSLAPGCEATPKGVRDCVSGTNYPMNAVGRFVVCELGAGRRFDELVQLVSKRFGIANQTVRSDLTDFLTFLDDHRLTSIRQSFLGETYARLGAFLRNVWLIAMRMTLPERARYPTRRYAASPASIAARCLEAHQATILTGYLFAAAAIGLYAIRNVHFGVPPISGLSITTAAILLGYFAGIVVSVVIHEYAHYIAAGILGITTRCVFVRMFVIGVSQQGGTDVTRALVSLAGPAAAVVFLLTLSFAFLVTQAGAPQVRFALSFALLMAIAQHIPSLLPWSTDGKQLGIVVRRRILNRAS